MLLSVVNLYVLLFFMIRIIHSRSQCYCDQPDLSFATGVNLLYYTCDNKLPTTIAYPITVPQTLLNVLDDNKRTIFYIFGYMQYPKDSNVELMMEALCYEQSDNVVLLDWSKYSNGTYAIVFRNAEKVGSLFAQSIQLLVNSGLDISKIYIVAHSLGAHIAGFVSKCNNFTIDRITALDPANPLFYPTGCYLNHSDAAWLDIIHTDIGAYGGAFTGTTDYYINGGIRPQPGCKLLGRPLSSTDLCSHQKSVVLYAQSKRYATTYNAQICTSYLHYMLKTILRANWANCKQIGQIGVGYTATNIRGSFYLSINNI